jgi:hypothetical protein
MQSVIHRHQVLVGMSSGVFHSSVIDIIEVESEIKFITRMWMLKNMISASNLASCRSFGGP